MAADAGSPRSRLSGSKFAQEEALQQQACLGAALVAAGWLRGKPGSSRFA